MSLLLLFPTPRTLTNDEAARIWADALDAKTANTLVGLASRLPAGDSIPVRLPAPGATGTIARGELLALWADWAGRSRARGWYLRIGVTHDGRLAVAVPDVCVALLT